MPDPVPISAVPPSPNEGVVDTLEQMLADAKAGRLRGYVMVGLLTGDETVTVNAGELVPHRALGAVAMLQHKILVSRINV